LLFLLPPPLLLLMLMVSVFMVVVIVIMVMIVVIIMGTLLVGAKAAGVALADDAGAVGVEEGAGGGNVRAGRFLGDDDDNDGRYGAKR
jgi:hypothetical protein